MTKLNPVKLLIGWTLLMIVLTPILVYMSSVGSSGGEQKPLTTLVSMPIFTVIGAAVICIVTPFIFKSWFLSNKWFVGLATFILIPTIIFLWQYYFEIPYSFEQRFEEINGNKIESKTEYYDIQDKILRSKSFWKNGKRDSTWTVLAKDGTIKSEKVYRNDTLVEAK